MRLVVTVKRPFRLKIHLVVFSSVGMIYRIEIHADAYTNVFKPLDLRQNTNTVFTYQLSEDDRIMKVPRAVFLFAAGTVI